MSVYFDRKLKNNKKKLARILLVLFISFGPPDTSIMIVLAVFKACFSRIFYEIIVYLIGPCEHPTQDISSSLPNIND